MGLGDGEGKASSCKSAFPSGQPALRGSEELDSKRFGLPLQGEPGKPFPATPYFSTIWDTVTREIRGSRCNQALGQTEFVRRV